MKDDPISPSQHVDPTHGHVTVYGIDGTPVAYLLDMGDVVRIDNYGTEVWSEQDAREVGAALIGWAARKRLARNAARGEQ